MVIPLARQGNGQAQEVIETGQRGIVLSLAVTWSSGEAFCEHVIASQRILVIEGHVAVTGRLVDGDYGALSATGRRA